MVAVRESKESRERELWVDALRVMMITGVVVLHTATGYVVDVAGWYYDERDASSMWSAALTVPSVLGALFWLGPLFLVAGWFAAVSLARRGAAVFLRTRLVHLGIPLVVFMVLVQPFTDYIGNRWDERGSFTSYLRRTEVGAMWFVAALLSFTVAYALLRRIRPLRSKRRSPRRGALLLAMVMITAASLAVWQVWPLTEEAFLNLRFSEWPQGAVLFWLGARAGEAGSLDDIPSLHEVRWLGWAALIGAISLMALLGIGLTNGAEDLGPGVGWPTIATAFLDGSSLSPGRCGSSSGSDTVGATRVSWSA